MIPNISPDDDDRSIAGQIARSLAEQIVTGALLPGVRLMQDEIATRFKASHVPVREAFRRLEAQGLIVSEPRRGARVASLEPEDVVEVTEMRAALEPLALKASAPRLTAADLATARSAMADCDGTTDITVWENANRRFHAALYLPGQRPRLLASIADLHRISARYLYAAWKDLDWQDRSSAEHSSIIRAVEKGAFDDASELLRDHILEAGHALADRMMAQRRSS